MCLCILLASPQSGQKWVRWDLLSLPVRFVLLTAILNPPWLNGGPGGNRTPVRLVTKEAFYVRILTLYLASVAVQARASDWPASRL